MRSCSLWHNRGHIGLRPWLRRHGPSDNYLSVWSGDATGTDTDLQVVMDQSKVITATFTRHSVLSLGPCSGGVRELGFQVTLSGDLAGRYQIDSSADLLHWTPFALLTNVFGSTQ